MKWTTSSLFSSWVQADQCYYTHWLYWAVILFVLTHNFCILAVTAIGTVWKRTSGQRSALGALFCWREVEGEGIRDRRKEAGKGELGKFRGVECGDRQLCAEAGLGQILLTTQIHQRQILHLSIGDSCDSAVSSCCTWVPAESDYDKLICHKLWPSFMFAKDLTQWLNAFWIW